MIDLEYDETRDPVPESARSITREICDRSEREIRRLLPALPLRIQLLVAIGKRVIPQIGCTGTAVAPGRIVFRFDPDHPGGAAVVIRNHLRATLYHEFHHLTRGWVVHGGPKRISLLEAIISEGLATAFERDFAGSTPPWGEYPGNVESWLEEVLALPTCASYREWMFHHPDGRQWIGYRTGTYIADRAKARSGLSAADLVRTPPGEVLTLAGIAA